MMEGKSLGSLQLMLGIIIMLHCWVTCLCLFNRRIISKNFLYCMLHASCYTSTKFTWFGGNMFVHHFILVISKRQRSSDNFLLSHLCWGAKWFLALQLLSVILVFNASAINVFLDFYYKLNIVKRIFRGNSLITHDELWINLFLWWMLVVFIDFDNLFYMGACEAANFSNNCYYYY